MSTDIHLFTKELIQLYAKHNIEFGYTVVRYKLPDKTSNIRMIDSPNSIKDGYIGALVRSTTEALIELFGNPDAEFTFRDPEIDN